MGDIGLRGVCALGRGGLDSYLGMGIPVNPQSTKIWRRLEIPFPSTVLYNFPARNAARASEGRGIKARFKASVGGRGGDGMSFSTSLG